MNRCKFCPLLFCDFTHRDCRLSPREVVRLRPELISDRGRKAVAQRKWRNANKQHCLDYDRRRYKNDSDAQVARVMEYQKNNPEKRAEAQRRYAAKHRVELNSYRRQRRAEAKQI